MENVTVLDRDTYIEQLQTIHALRDKLGLSGDDYRELLHRLTGSRSAKYMTPAQRARVITFMLVHKSLDEAIQSAEEARYVLNKSYGVSPANVMEKVIHLEGKREATMNASLEDVIETMRTLHGPDVRLSGVTERRSGGKTSLELTFERPAVYLLAS